MKKLILLFSLVIFPIFTLVSATPSQAQTCSSLNGRCILPLQNCAIQPPISGATDCLYLAPCCPLVAPPGTSCVRDLNGSCVFSGTCAHGAPLSASDCNAPGFKCCPTAPGPDDCQNLGGHCVLPLQNCAHGGPIISATGCLYGGSCCPNTGGPSPASGGCPNGDYVNTALGCLDITGKPTISSILLWSVGVGGGVAFLLIVYAGFQMVSSSGDPKRVKAAQELLTAALSGLALIVIAVVLLNFIGVNLLGLNGLGFNL